MHIPHVVTLAEAAEYLSSSTTIKWTARSTLDFALSTHRQTGAKPTPVAFAAPSPKATFGEYVFLPGDQQPKKRKNVRWQLVPLYPWHAGQLIACGETLAGGCDDYLDEHSNFCLTSIDPIDGEFIVSLEMVRLKKEQLLTIASRFQKQVDSTSGVQSISGCSPSNQWSRGLKRVAWDCAVRLHQDNKQLSAASLDDCMCADDRVTVSGDTLQYSRPDGSLKRGEDEVKKSTLANWATALNKKITQKT